MEITCRILKILTGSATAWLLSSCGFLFLFFTMFFSVSGQVSQTYTSSNTWTSPAGVTSVVVECWGGGGAGGGQNLASDGGGGGGGGAYSKKTITITGSTNYTVTVGTGGTGVAGGTGGNGGDSWFWNSSTILAKGGLGGGPSTGTPPAGGAGGQASAGIGDLKYSGGQGEKGRDNGTGLGGYGGSSAGIGSDGYSGPQTYSTNVYPTGSTPAGAGHGGDGGAANANGSAPASGNGGGGGGSGEGTNKTGGNGAAGKVIVTYTTTRTLGNNNQSAFVRIAGATNVPIHSFSLTCGNGNTTITGINFVTTGTYSASEISNFKLYYTTTATFATTNLLATIASPAAAGTQSFPAISHPIVAATHYFWVTMDMASSVTDGNTLAVNSTSSANITADVAPTGTAAASGIQTLYNGGAAGSGIRINLVSGYFNIYGAADSYKNEDVGTDYGRITSSGTIKVSGNWVNNSSDPTYKVFTSSSGTLTFAGTSAQYIKGSSITDFNNLTINNTSAGGVVLSKPASVSGTLTLTDGVLTSTAANLLTLKDGATATAGVGSPTFSYVSGPVKKVGNDAFTFPMGYGASSFGKIEISAPADPSTEFTAEYKKTAYGNTTLATSPTPVLTDVSATEYWTLDRAVTTDNVTVKLYWEDASASNINFDCAELKIAHWCASCNGGSGWWENNNDVAGYTGSCAGTNSGYVITSTAVSSFSPFTFGRRAGSATTTPLPVTLLDFTATCRENAIYMHWSTASEINNDYFTVERGTEGKGQGSSGLIWEEISVVKGAGNSSTLQRYEFRDDFPMNDSALYRLRQTDYDGRFEYSPAVAVDCGKREDAAMLVFPSPAKGDFRINIRGKKGEDFLVVLYDVTGRKRYSMIIFSEHDNYSVVLNGSGDLPAGMYMVVASSVDSYYRQKVVLK